MTALPDRWYPHQFALTIVNNEDVHLQRRHGRGSGGYDNCEHLRLSETQASLGKQATNHKRSISVNTCEYTCITWRLIEAPQCNSHLRQWLWPASTATWAGVWFTRCVALSQLPPFSSRCIRHVNWTKTKEIYQKTRLVRKWLELTIF